MYCIHIEEIYRKNVEIIISQNLNELHIFRINQIFFLIFWRTFWKPIGHFQSDAL